MIKTEGLSTKTFSFVLQKKTKAKNNRTDKRYRCPFNEKTYLNKNKIHCAALRGHKLVKISHFSLMLSYGKILTSGVRCGGVANFSFEFDTFVLKGQ